MIVRKQYDHLETKRLYFNTKYAVLHLIYRTKNKFRYLKHNNEEICIFKDKEDIWCEKEQKMHNWFLPDSCGAYTNAYGDTLFPRRWQAWKDKKICRFKMNHIQDLKKKSSFWAKESAVKPPNAKEHGKKDLFRKAFLSAICSWKRVASAQSHVCCLQNIDQWLFNQILNHALSHWGWPSRDYNQSKRMSYIYQIK